jgi:hypothetical protein
MKKLVSIFAVLLIATPAIAVPNTKVATTSYVQGAFDALDTVKQDVIDSTHKLSADLVEDGTTNKVVTATEKSTWNGKQDAITVSGGTTSTDGQYVDGVALSNGTMTVHKSYLTVPVKNNGSYAATGVAIWFE